LTERAVAALTELKADLDALVETLSGDSWDLPSGCPGWSVRDVIAHLAASAHNFVDPQPERDGTSLPADRERQHDVYVDRRRHLPVGAVVDEYLQYSAGLIRAVGKLQTEPKASKTVSVPGLGSYPLHSLADGMAFDYHCHLHHDLRTPRGPLQRTIAVRDEAVRAALDWMFLGLPQMQGPDLDDALKAPLCFDLTGPGGGIWTVTRPDPQGGLLVEQGRGSDTVLRSDAHAFIGWGTKRYPWREHCQIEGEVEAAARFLDVLDII
jgi:uncharacterized protein (TIGR03083 family)